MNFSLPNDFSWVDLSDDLYKNTLEKILFTNQNLNIIGRAGSGKSTLLKLAVKMLKQAGQNVVLLSSTGIAAVNISGNGSCATTLHSFFKIKPLDINLPESIQTHPTMWEIMEMVDVFIIDEVSMISSQLFDYVVENIRTYREYKLPRIILFSDILQLPPVISSEDHVQKYYKENYDGNVFFFNSKAFKEFEFITIQLQHIFRQKDEAFQSILNRIRESTQTNQDLAIINQYRIYEEDFYKKHELYMNVTTTNKASNDLNEKYFYTFNTEPKLYNAQIIGQFDTPYNSPLKPLVRLKKDMQVMCLKNNYNEGYMNGTIGKVVEMHPTRVVIKTNNGRLLNVVQEEWEQYDYKVLNEKLEPAIKGKFIQLGCVPAISITVFKAQGQTFDAMYFDIERFNPESAVYVGLSRLTSIEGLGLKRIIEHKNIKVNKEALKFLYSC